MKNVAFNISGYLNIPEDWIPRKTPEGSLTHFETPSGVVISLFAGLQRDQGGHIRRECDMEVDGMEYDFREFTE